MTPRRAAIAVTLAGVACLIVAAWIFHYAAGLAALGVVLTGIGLLAIPAGNA